ncbi:MAG TPA: aldehyde dehydrogenase family protein [Leptospiraceae bacterium]|nr:aldehyde dehydrogenase family protein [Leptospiraceae bacterium]
MLSLINWISDLLKAGAANADLEKTRARIDAVFAAQSERRPHVARTNAKQRIVKLKAMLQWIYAHRDDIHKALRADFQKPEAETDLSEILVVTSEIKHAISHLRRWMKPRRVGASLTFLTTSSSVQFEPRGVVLILSPWNFPFNLTMGPLVSAVAAGNCVMIKPSEFTPATNAVMRQLISEIFPEEEVAMFEGDKEVATLLLDKPFHHIFFTGSPAVGRVVQTAAAKHLSTVTLELGGKSPVIVDKSVDMADAGKKISWGKFMNNGQTCIAPDYALVHKDRYAEFIEGMKKTVASYYGKSEEERKQSPHYARIISSRHHARLSDMVAKSVEQGAKLEFGGITDTTEQYIAPTLLSDVPLSAPVMQEEIFGPILPVIPIDSLEEGLGIVSKLEKPLALYFFSKSNRHIKYVLSETTSGGTCINETLIHFLHPNLPFGGVNFSGSGNSHGFYGFRAFSHERAVLKHHRFAPMKLMFPPYTNTVRKLIEFVVKYL